MRVLAWLVVPLGITAIAAAWVAWRGSGRRPHDPAEGARAYSRFQAALQRPHPDRARTVVRQPPMPGHAVGVRWSTGGARPTSAGRPSEGVDSKR